MGATIANWYRITFISRRGRVIHGTRNSEVIIVDRILRSRGAVLDSYLLFERVAANQPRSCLKSSALKLNAGRWSTLLPQR